MENLLKLYQPPSILKTNHKKLIKTVLSLKHGYDGSKDICFSCKRLLESKDLQVHHKDGNISHNDIDNLDDACADCNYKEGWLVRRRKVAEREQERVPSAQPSSTQTIPISDTPASSRELEKAEDMRPAWNAWVNDMERGPFAGEGAKIRAKDLSRMAVHALGGGSSITYRRYIDEDEFGWFNLEKIGRIVWVTYRGK